MGKSHPLINLKPFIIYRRPGSETDIRKELSITTENEMLFADVRVHTWNDESISTMDVCNESTPHDRYISAVTSAVSLLRTQGGKTVLCRCICGKFNTFDPMELWDKYCRKFPHTFRFLLYTPSTGYWMGASPELLIDIESPSKASTRALAGTRLKTAGIAWDRKNIEEHNIVVEDIISNIHTLGNEWKAEAAKIGTLSYGEIEHLCTPIFVHTSEGNAAFPVDKLISALHPTAAIAGFPRSQALDEIKRLEEVPRKLYGGYIATPDEVYVILRCVHFNEHNWCIYSGSGITPLSVPEDEWQETQAKAAPLLHLLTS